MIRVTFVAADGAVTEAVAEPGARLLYIAQNAGQSLEGTCNGMMACGTCHVIVDPADAARLSPPVPEEEDMLDLLPTATRNSRLSCQITLTPALGAITVRVVAA